MAKLCLLFVTFFVGALIANSHSKVISGAEENIVDVDIVTETESELDKKIQDLRQKIKDLVEQSKENERAFNSMSDRVKNMDSKVKEMTERLRKINNADYLNAGEEAIKNL